MANEREDRMPRGVETLITILKRLEALHHQVMNYDPKRQEIGTYGIMVPRFAVAPGSSAEDHRELQLQVARRRAAQDVRLIDAIKVTREIIKEHAMATDLTPGEIQGSA